MYRDVCFNGRTHAHTRVSHTHTFIPYVYRDVCFEASKNAVVNDPKLKFKATTIGKAPLLYPRRATAPPCQPADRPAPRLIWAHEL